MKERGRERERAQQKAIHFRRPMNYHLDADIRWAHDNGYGINNLKQYVCAYVRARVWDGYVAYEAYIFGWPVWR